MRNIIKIHQRINNLSYLLRYNRNAICQKMTVRPQRLYHITTNKICNFSTTKKVLPSQITPFEIEKYAKIQDFLQKHLVDVEVKKNTQDFMKRYLKKFLKLLTQDIQNRSIKQIFTKNKDLIQKLIYTLRSQQNQNLFEIQQFIQMFYIVKILSDNGYQNVISGFQYRAMIKLLSELQIYMKQSQYQYKKQTDSLLKLPDVINIYWLSVNIHSSNHEFKWKTYLKLLKLYIQQTKNNSKTRKKTQFFLSLHEITSILSTHSMQQTKMTTEFNMIQLLVQCLIFSNQFQQTGQKFKKNEFILIDLFSKLSEVQNIWLRNLVSIHIAHITNTISKQIVKLLKAVQHDKITNTQQFSNYYIVFQSIVENQSLLSHIKYQYFNQLKTLIVNYFSKSFQSESNLEQLSFLALKLRVKFYSIQKKGAKLQIEDPQKNIILSNQIIDIIKNVTQLIKKQVILINGGQLTKDQQKRRAVYIKAQQKESFNRLTKLYNKIQTQFIFPLIDFLNKIQKNNQIIKMVVPILEQFIGQIPSAKALKFDNIQNKKTLRIWNKHFWTLKYINLKQNLAQTQIESSFTSILKQVQQLILLKNESSFQNINIQSVVYNLFGYICKLEQLVPYNKKNQQKIWFNYKNYLRYVIFRNSQIKQLKLIQNKIPVSYQINKILKPIQTKLISNRIFSSVFKQTRYYNHPTLSYQFIMEIFGNKKQLHNSILLHVQHINLRSLYNLQQLTYFIMQAKVPKGFNKNDEQNKSNKQNKSKYQDLMEIKRILGQIIRQKCKGNTIIKIIHQIIAIKKSSYLAKAPMQYSLNPDSLFEIFKHKQDQQRILRQFIEIFPVNNQQKFLRLQLIFSNLDHFQDINSIIIKFILPWIKNNSEINLSIGNYDYLIKSIGQMLKFNQITINQQTEKDITQFFIFFLRIISQNVLLDQKPHRLNLFVNIFEDVYEVAKQSSNSFIEQIICIFQQCCLNIGKKLIPDVVRQGKIIYKHEKQNKNLSGIIISLKKKIKILKQNKFIP